MEQRAKSKEQRAKSREQRAESKEGSFDASTMEYVMSGKPKEVVIPKENAVFWLDKNGFWHYGHEKFQHRKIINYFHSSIRKDKEGYYVVQAHRDHVEKVYFPYEDTALFVFDVIRDEDITLVLNTGKRIKLQPKKLFIKDDSLYMHFKEERVKFTEQALVRISDLIKDDNDQCHIRVRGKKYRIRPL